MGTPLHRFGGCWISTRKHGANCRSDECRFCGRNVCRRCFSVRCRVTEQRHCLDCNVLMQYHAVFLCLNRIFPDIVGEGGMEMLDINVIPILTEFTVCNCTACCQAADDVMSKLEDWNGEEGNVGFAECQCNQCKKLCPRMDTK